jgi:hypothetical protein
LLLAIGSGCSFALSGPDPKQPRGQEPKCDTEKTSVLGDSLLATAAGVTTLAVGANNGGAAIAPAILGAVFVAAAIHGNNAVNQCRSAKAEYIASLQTAPPPVADGDDSDERAASAQRARLIRTRPAVTFVPAGSPPAAAPPADAPADTADSAPAPVPAPASAPAPAAPPPPPPAPPGTAPTWSAFWKEVH